MRRTKLVKAKLTVKSRAKRSAPVTMPPDLIAERFTRILTSVIYEATNRVNEIQRSRLNWQRATFFVLLAYVAMFILLTYGIMDPAPYILKDH